MKKLYTIKFILILCSIISLGFFTSCENDDAGEVNNGQVTLLSFGPTGAKHGETIKFIGYNLDKVETIALPNATIQKAQFTSQSADVIELVIPQTASAGKVMLKTTAGEEIASKTVLSFEVPVTITSLSAEVKPGNNVTVTGNFLNWVDSVKFSTSNDYIKAFVSKSINELVFTVPMNAKTGILTFYTGGTEPLAIEAADELIVTLPKVTAIAPNPLKHSENLTLTGTDLDLVREVRFTGVGAANVTSFISQSVTSLVVKVPDNAKGGTLTLVVPSMETVTTTQALTITLPLATAVSPTPVAEGANFTITGTNLDLVKEVIFPGVTAGVSNFISQTATQMVVKVPTGSINGFIKFKTVKNFEVVTAVKITMPGNGPAPLKYALYKDVLENGWQDWSNSADLGSTANVFDGSKAIKVNFKGGWESWGGGFFPSGAPAATYSEFTMWVYGGPGTTGKINLIVNPGNWDDRHVINVVAGKWTEVTFPLSSFVDNNGKPNPATWTDIRMQAQGINGDVWFDYIGFR